MVRWIHWDFSCQDLKSMSKCVQYVLSDVPSILVGEDADDGEGGEEAGEDCWLCDGLCADGLGSGVSAASLEPERRAIRRPTSESQWCPSNKTLWGNPWYKMYEAPHLVAWGKWRSHPSTWQPSREAKIASKKTWQSSDGGSVQATLLTHRTGWKVNVVNAVFVGAPWFASSGLSMMESCQFNLDMLFALAKLKLAVTQTDT